MPQALSKPLTEPPGFLSTISMIVDDQSTIIQDLIQAERKSPSVYEPAKELFCRVLQGDFSFEQGLDQARKIQGKVERKCAVEIFQASREFLKKESRAQIIALPKLSFRIPCGLSLNINQLLVRHLKPDRLLILHFWRTPLSPRQLSATATTLRSAIAKNKPEYLSYDLDFISVAIPENGTVRSFRKYDWKTLKPLKEADLDKFWKLFCEAWQKYQRLPPRTYTKRNGPTLFDSYNN